MIFLQLYNFAKFVHKRTLDPDPHPHSLKMLDPYPDPFWSQCGSTTLTPHRKKRLASHVRIRPDLYSVALLPPPPPPPISAPPPQPAVLPRRRRSCGGGPWDRWISTGCGRSIRCHLFAVYTPLWWGISIRCHFFAVFTPLSPPPPPTSAPPLSRLCFLGGGEVAGTALGTGGQVPG